MARGNNNAGLLRAFVNQVETQSGKHIPADVAALLIVAAKQLEFSKHGNDRLLAKVRKLDYWFSHALFYNFRI